MSLLPCLNNPINQRALNIHFIVDSNFVDISLYDEFLMLEFHQVSFGGFNAIIRQASWYGTSWYDTRHPPFYALHE